MRRYFSDEKEWAEYWRGEKVSPFGWRPRRSSCQGRLGQAGHFLAGVLLLDGYRLFQNGGMPLLERRHGSFVEEIVLRAAPFRAAEGVLPIRVDLHLSHQGLREVRWPYWHPSSRIPVSVASADLGELHDPRGRLVWTVGETSVALEDMAFTVARLALPWFDRFRRPQALCDALFAQEVPLVDHATSVELILAECGRYEARRYLTEHIAGEERFWRALDEVRELVQPDTDTVDGYRRLAGIAQFCHLL